MESSSAERISQGSPERLADEKLLEEMFSGSWQERLPDVEQALSKKARAAFLKLPFFKLPLQDGRSVEFQTVGPRNPATITGIDHPEGPTVAYDMLLRASLGGVSREIPFSAAWTGWNGIQVGSGSVKDIRRQGQTAKFKIEAHVLDGTAFTMEYEANGGEPFIQKDPHRAYHEFLYQDLTAQTPAGKAECRVALYDLTEDLPIASAVGAYSVEEEVARIRERRREESRIDEPPKLTEYRYEPFSYSEGDEYRSERHGTVKTYHTVTLKGYTLSIQSPFLTIADTGFDFRGMPNHPPIKGLFQGWASIEGVIDETTYREHIRKYFVYIADKADALWGRIARPGELDQMADGLMEQVLPYRVAITPEEKAGAAEAKEVYESQARDLYQELQSIAIQYHFNEYDSNVSKEEVASIRDILSKAKTALDAGGYQHSLELLQSVESRVREAEAYRKRKEDCRFEVEEMIDRHCSKCPICGSELSRDEGMLLCGNSTAHKEAIPVPREAYRDLPALLELRTDADQVAAALYLSAGELGIPSGFIYRAEDRNLPSAEVPWQGAPYQKLSCRKYDPATGRLVDIPSE
jgi:hypothetical protein